MRNGASLSATILGRLHVGDIFWIRWNAQGVNADRYFWLPGTRDSMSNMGQRSGWIASDFVRWDDWREEILGTILNLCT